MLEKYIKLWVGSPKGVSPVIRLSQYDTEWRLICTIYNGDEIWEIPDTGEVVLNGRKPDGTVFSAAGEIEDNAVKVVIPASGTVSAGKVECELSISTDGEIVGTANFVIDVEKAPMSGHTASKDDFSAVNQLVNKALTAAETAGSAEEAVATIKAAVSSPLKASTVAGMVDENKVYVYTGSESGMTTGHWYYYDGSAWQDGGVYNAAAVNTDKTLLVENQAADSKAAGAAVSGLRQSVDGVDGVQILEFVDGYYDVKAKGSIMNLVVQTNTPNRKCAICDCSEGDMFTLTCAGAGTSSYGAVSYAYVDSSNRVLLRASSGSLFTNYTTVAPENSVKVVFNHRTDGTGEGVNYYAVKGVTPWKKFESGEATTQAIFDYLDKNIGLKPYPLTRGYSTTPESGFKPAEFVNTAAWRRAVLECAEGDVFWLKFENVDINSDPPKRGYAFYDINGDRLQASSASLSTREYFGLTAPEGAKYLVVNTKSSNGEWNSFVYKYNHNDWFLHNRANLFKKDYFLWNGSYIDDTNAYVILNPQDTVTPRSLMIPAKPGATYRIMRTIASTMRVCYITEYQQHAEAKGLTMSDGSNTLSLTIKCGDDAKYLFVQLFVNSDSVTDIDSYIGGVTITEYTGEDSVAQATADKVHNDLNKHFYFDNISGSHILDSYTEISLPQSLYTVRTWNNALIACTNVTAFHEYLYDNIVDSAAYNGYVTRHTITEDGVVMTDTDGNPMYYYLTHPPKKCYLSKRGYGSPVDANDFVDPTGGVIEEPFKIMVTTNIHFSEYGGNFVMLNLLEKMFDDTIDDDFVNWMYENVQFIWIPCCAGSSSSAEASWYRNSALQNVNRSFPYAVDGECICDDVRGPASAQGTICKEAQFIKAVCDEFADVLELEIDIHQFRCSAQKAFISWIFTDDRKLGRRGSVASNATARKYQKHYHNSIFNKRTGGFANTLNTIANYAQMAHGIPGATIEAGWLENLNPGDFAFEEGYNFFHLATALLFDTFVNMVAAYFNRG